MAGGTNRQESPHSHRTHLRAWSRDRRRGRRKRPNRPKRSSFRAGVPAPGYFLRPWSYELDMRLSEPGRWVFEIQVDSSLGETVIEVPLVVAPGSGPETPGESGSRPFGGPNWILISGIVALLALGSGGWACISRQRAETRPNRRRRRR